MRAISAHCNLQYSYCNLTRTLLDRLARLVLPTKQYSVKPSNLAQHSTLNRPREASMSGDLKASDAKVISTEPLVPLITMVPGAGPS